MLIIAYGLINQNCISITIVYFMRAFNYIAFSFKHIHPLLSVKIKHKGFVIVQIIII